MRALGDFLGVKALVRFWPESAYCVCPIAFKQQTDWAVETKKIGWRKTQPMPTPLSLSLCFLKQDGALPGQHCDSTSRLRKHLPHLASPEIAVCFRRCLLTKNILNPRHPKVVYSLLVTQSGLLPPCQTMSNKIHNQCGVQHKIGRKVMGWTTPKQFYRAHLSNSR